MVSGSVETLINKIKKISNDIIIRWCDVCFVNAPHFLDSTQ